MLFLGFCLYIVNFGKVSHQAFQCIPLTMGAECPLRITQVPLRKFRLYCHPTRPQLRAAAFHTSPHIFSAFPLRISAVCVIIK